MCCLSILSRRLRIQLNRLQTSWQPIQSGTTSRTASSFGALPPGAASADFSKRLFTVNELTPASLFATDCDLLSQLDNPELLQLFSFLEKTESIPHHFALGLVHATVEQFNDKLVENGAQIDVHTQ